MPTPTYTPLATVTLGSSASGITFSSIPATYRDLILICQYTNDNNPLVRFNSDSGNNYSFVRMLGSGSAAFSDSDVNQSGIAIATGSATSGQTSIVQIMDYSATDKHKTVLIRNGLASTFVNASANRWANTPAINTISFQVGTYGAGSTFSLYGVIA
jgi:hypothetical protein